MRAGATVIAVLLVAIAVVACEGTTPILGGDTMALRITSSAFNDNTSIPQEHTCQGKNVNPPLSFDGIPPNTRSLVLIMDDPDAPVGTWDHWIIWNIAPNIRMIAENSVPQGAVQGVNTRGVRHYQGPCPPSGTHRYFFKLYALDTTLDIPETSRKQQVEGAMEGHIIEQAQIVGLYRKS